MLGREGTFTDFLLILMFYCVRQKKKEKKSNIFSVKETFTL